MIETPVTCYRAYIRRLWCYPKAGAWFHGKDGEFAFLKCLTEMISWTSVSSFYRWRPIEWQNQQCFPLPLHLSKQMKTRFMVRQSYWAVKHASYWLSIHGFSKKHACPYKVQIYNQNIFFSPVFFFFWQVKRLSDFYVSLDFIHEVVMTYQGPSPWKSLFWSHLSLVTGWWNSLLIMFRRMEV